MNTRTIEILEEIKKIQADRRDNHADPRCHADHQHDTVAEIAAVSRLGELRSELEAQNLLVLARARILGDHIARYGTFLSI
jgi:hypothetical protein